MTRHSLPCLVILIATVSSILFVSLSGEIWPHAVVHESFTKSIGTWKGAVGAKWSSLLSGSDGADAEPYMPLNVAGLSSEMGRNTIPYTTYEAGVAGFSHFRNLYLHNGSFYAVTPLADRDVFPSPLSKILGGPPVDDGTYDQFAEPDTVGRWTWLDPETEDVEAILGAVAVREQGLSMFFNDEPGVHTASFLNHYYHFIAEGFLGAWRVAVAADPGLLDRAELPSRIIYRTFGTEWRDYHGLTTWLLKTVLNEASIEDSLDWADRTRSGETFLFEQISIVARHAAHAYGLNPWRHNRMTADLPLVDVPVHWMKPLRDRMKMMLAAEGCEWNYSETPVVVYVNRQGSGRRLKEPDAARLVEALLDLEAQGIIEFHNTAMEALTKDEQFCLATRADILLGVHGNGLTHQVWMKPQSSVIEIMYPPGFTMDYAVPAKLMGHDYYAIHNDSVFPESAWEKEDGWGVGQVEGFHGSNIPVDAEFIASLVASIASSKPPQFEA